jgi:hypothetical protein
MGNLSTRWFCSSEAWEGLVLALVVVPADMSLAMELLDRAVGTALDCWYALGAGWDVFRCRMNQITTAAPATIHKIVFRGNAFVFGDGSGIM